jgi:hypothetical protein
MEQGSWNQLDVLIGLVALGAVGADNSEATWAWIDP